MTMPCGSFGVTWLHVLPSRFQMPDAKFPYRKRDSTAFTAAEWGNSGTLTDVIYSAHPDAFTVSVGILLNVAFYATAYETLTRVSRKTIIVVLVPGRL